MKRADLEARRAALARQCAVSALSPREGRPRPRVRRGRLFVVSLRAGARRLHRAEQALRDPGLRPAVRRGGRGRPERPRVSPERYRSGLLAPPASPDDLARQIRRLYDDPALRERLAANGAARRPRMTGRSRSPPTTGCSARWPTRRAASPRACPRSSAPSTSRCPGLGCSARCRSGARSRRAREARGRRLRSSSATGGWDGAVGSSEC